MDRLQFCQVLFCLSTLKLTWGNKTGQYIDKYGINIHDQGRSSNDTSGRNLSHDNLNSSILRLDDQREIHPVIHGACRCCPWKLVMHNPCLVNGTNRKSYDDHALILNFFPASSQRKESVENIMNVTLDMLGIGTGYEALSSSDVVCTDNHDSSVPIEVVSEKDNGEKTKASVAASRGENAENFILGQEQGRDKLVFGWSIHHKDHVASPDETIEWHALKGKLYIQNIKQRLMAEATFDSFLQQYLEKIFYKFERRNSCGKEVRSQERRCLHHILSPLRADQKNYKKSTESMLSWLDLVS